MRRNPIVVLGLAATLVLGFAACSDDDNSAPDESGTTTTIDSPTRPKEPVTENTTTETEPGATTDPDDPTGSTKPPDTTPNSSPLNERLTDPADIGGGFALDGTLGDGSFDTDLCEDVTLDVTWDDEASQAMRSTTGDATVYLTEALLSFSDADAASDFVTAVSDGITTCLPDAKVRPRPDLADEAVVLEVDDNTTTMLTALVRSGARVAVLGTTVDKDGTSPLSDALLSDIAARLR